MKKEVLYIYIFVVTFLFIPILIGILVQRIWGQQGYSIMAGFGTFLLFSIIGLLIERGRASESARASDASRR